MRFQLLGRVCCDVPTAPAEGATAADATGVRTAAGAAIEAAGTAPGGRGSDAGVPGAGAVGERGCEDATAARAFIFAAYCAAKMLVLPAESGTSTKVPHVG